MLSFSPDEIHNALAHAAKHREQLPSLVISSECGYESVSFDSQASASASQLLPGVPGVPGVAGAGGESFGGAGRQISLDDAGSWGAMGMGMGMGMGGQSITTSLSQDVNGILGALMTAGIGTRDDLQYAAAHGYEPIGTLGRVYVGCTCGS